ncbi:flavin-containing monooxygenase [Marmoricola endophyticus]|uniref:flavin-containing monooxygenase n=1 Tax=Marmoricola endophyticus TaxID=2040280 RepID=UPI0016660D4F|nr:NAD(P)/FAD-dependent oxidoreductase [Marmoricola endophyticus]
MAEHVDVLIVGAGLSGIGAACRLEIAARKGLRRRSVAVLEARAASGGTWDLFRYPGVRSDSDMFTLGYSFRPWDGDKQLADGPSILSYVRATAREFGIDEQIRYDHRVVAADWSSTDQRWAVLVEHAGEQVALTCDLLWSTSGYYDYDAGFTPALPHLADFEGTVVHPQQWPEDLDATGKRFVVIGSGATAVTLVPALAAEGAGHVTMLQRSPTYIMPLPARDPVARRLGKVLPAKAAHHVNRWRSVLQQSALYAMSRWKPDRVRALVRRLNVAALPAGYDVDTHFKPRYDPWDQRLCVVPDGDLFRAIRDGDATVVTDTIERFTPKGIALTSGEELDADVVVTATGLNLKPLGGVTLAVDGEPVSLPDTMAYKAMLLSGVPNFVFTIGYTNASWTLKADLVCDYVVRLLQHLDATGKRSFTPQRQAGVEERPLLDFAAGYVLRAVDEFPRSGDRAPWMLKQNYLRDAVTMRRTPVDDDAMQFA